MHLALCKPNGEGVIPVTKKGIKKMERELGRISTVKTTFPGEMTFQEREHRVIEQVFWSSLYESLIKNHSYLTTEAHIASEELNSIVEELPKKLANRFEEAGSTWATANELEGFIKGYRLAFHLMREGMGVGRKYNSVGDIIEYVEKGGTEK